jgi:hypothetical protein
MDQKLFDRFASWIRYVTYPIDLIQRLTSTQHKMVLTCGEDGEIKAWRGE